MPETVRVHGEIDEFVNISVSASTRSGPETCCILWLPHWTRSVISESGSLLPRVYVVEEDKLQNQMVAGELLRQGREGDGSVDAGQGRAVERLGT